MIINLIKYFDDDNFIFLWYDMNMSRGEDKKYYIDKFVKEKIHSNTSVHKFYDGELARKIYNEAYKNWEAPQLNDECYKFYVMVEPSDEFDEIKMMDNSNTKKVHMYNNIYTFCFVNYPYLCECVKKDYVPQKSFFDDLIHEHINYCPLDDNQYTIYFTKHINQSSISNVPQKTYSKQINSIIEHVNKSIDSNSLDENIELESIPELRIDLKEHQKHNIEWMTKIENNNLVCEYANKTNDKTNDKTNNKTNDKIDKYYNCSIKDIQIDYDFDKNRPRIISTFLKQKLEEHLIDIDDDDDDDEVKIETIEFNGCVLISNNKLDLKTDIIGLSFTADKNKSFNTEKLEGKTLIICSHYRLPDHRPIDWKKEICANLMHKEDIKYKSDNIKVLNTRTQYNKYSYREICESDFVICTSQYLICCLPNPQIDMGENDLSKLEVDLRNIHWSRVIMYEFDDSSFYRVSEIVTNIKSDKKYYVSNLSDQYISYNFEKIIKWLAKDEFDMKLLENKDIENFIKNKLIRKTSEIIKKCDQPNNLLHIQT